MASVLTSITLGALRSIFRDIIIALQYCQHFFAQNLALYNKDKSLSVSGPMCDRFPRKFDVQISYKPSNYVLGLIFVVNIKFPRTTYHTIVPSTQELYCLNSYP